MFDPYAGFIKAVAQDTQIFQGQNCVLSHKALALIGQVIEGYPYSVAITYVLDRARRANPKERLALRRLQSHIRTAIQNGLNPEQVGFLVRKMDAFPYVVKEALS
jgi:hypothetical protein